MQVSITQENLHKALNAVARVVGSRTTLPVLGNVLLRTQDNRLKLAATNLEIGVTYWIGAKVEAEGDITVPAKLLSEYISNLPSGNIDISVEKSTAQIRSDSFQSKINGIDADEFPSIPEVDGDIKMQIPVETFKTALSQVVGVASSDDSRPVLTGVYLYTTEGSLYAVATDSYRLAEKQVMEFEGECSVIIPSRTIAEILRMIDDATVKNIDIAIDENQISFHFGDVELVSRLIDGQFPNYRQLIPEEVPTRAVVETKQLRNITKVTSLFARENAGSVNLSVTGSALSMRSITSQVGENNSEISAEVSGDPIEISLNGRYVSDALSVIGTDTIEIGLTGKVSACIIKPTGDESYLHIVMPLRS
ncbi:MAG: DNA polymerase III subunit beta [Candidatus Saccharimonadales bacterium]